jgi:DNA polymerase-3 subunit beta
VKFEIPQEELQKALDLVSGVVPTKTTLPILKSILVDAGDHGLRFSVTNLDISMVTVTEAASVATAGRAAVPAEKFVSFVRSLAPGSVEVALTGGKLTVRSGKASLSEQVQNAEEYPSLPELADQKALPMPGDVLTAMISETAYAVSRDETRPALMGIHWEVAPEGLTMVATDAHRLARSRRKLDWACDQTRAMIVDTAGLRHLSRVAGQAGDDGEVAVFLGENQISFRAGGTVLHTRLIEGPFPDYDAVIPKDNEKLVTVDRDALAQAIRRVSITADRVTSQIRMGLESERLELSARGQDGSRAEDEIPVGYDGEAMEIGFNYTYLLDILKNVGSDTVQFALKDAQSAALIAPASDTGEADPSLLCLLMPLRLAGD